jgi:quinol-cytochrome oxidoreductase complex cytochrome b subunit
MLDKTKILEEKRRKYIGFLILFFIILFIMFSICGGLIKIDIVSSFYGAIIFLAITFFLSFKI